MVGVFNATNDKYDEGRLDYDIRLLRQFYLARGYADIKIERGSWRLTAGSKWL